MKLNIYPSKRWKEENDDLTAQEGIPNARQFLPETAEVLGIAGNFHLENILAQAAALSQHKKGDH